MRKSVILAFIFSAHASLAIADDSVPAACLTIFGAAKSAIANKEDHVPESTLRAALPPRSKIGNARNPDVAEIALSLNEIVDDVYGDFEVEPTIYATYKAEVCVRRLAHKAVPPSFRSIQSELTACAKKPRDLAIQCAMGVAGSKDSDDSA